MGEVARRYRHLGLQLWEALRRLREIDWPAVTLKMYQTPLRDPMPDDAEEAINARILAAAMVRSAGGSRYPKSSEKSSFDVSTQMPHASRSDTSEMAAA